MKFTVLGATGVIGSALVEHLTNKGHQVFSPERECELIFSQSLGHVIYAVGITADFRYKPYETVEAHVFYLSEILKRADFDSLLYLSSTRLYQGMEQAGEEDDIKVNTLNLGDIYNISKLMGESLCFNSKRKEVRVARISNVIGGNDSKSENFIPSLYRDAEKGHIRLRSSLDSSKDYIHIDDVVRLLVNISTSGRYNLYNVASGFSISHKYWIDVICSEYECTVDVDDDAFLDIHPSISVERVSEEFYFESKLIKFLERKLCKTT